MAPKFTIATWNVNSINVRLSRVQAFLKRNPVDVLCLQELKCTEDKFPSLAFQEMGYHSACLGQKTYNGVAILSTHPIKDVQTGFNDGENDTESRFIGATIQGMRVFSIYVPNGQEVGSDKYLYKLQWLERLHRYLMKKHQASEPLILTGDFNIAPQEIDVHDPTKWKGKILCSERERKRFRELLQYGFYDLAREKWGSTQRFTWWDYRELAFIKNLGLRIDFLLGTKTLLDACQAIEVDRNERKGDKPSDHTPVIGTFTWP